MADRDYHWIGGATPEPGPQWREPLPNHPFTQDGVTIHPCMCSDSVWRRTMDRLEAPYDRED